MPSCKGSIGALCLDTPVLVFLLYAEGRLLFYSAVVVITIKAFTFSYHLEK